MEPSDAGSLVAVTDLVKLALGLGLGTLALRIGGAELRQHWTLPPFLQDALEWLPVAALAAMISPVLAPSPQSPIDVPFLLAAVVSGWIGFRTRNMLWGVGSGLLAFWCTRWLLT